VRACLLAGPGLPSEPLCSVCVKPPPASTDKERNEGSPMDIGVPETEREIEITPLEEPVPSPAPVEEPVEEPVAT
jgi:hypothetical protein